MARGAGLVVKEVVSRRRLRQATGGGRVVGVVRGVRGGEVGSARKGVFAGCGGWFAGGRWTINGRLAAVGGRKVPSGRSAAGQTRVAGLGNGVIDTGFSCSVYSKTQGKAARVADRSQERLEGVPRDGFRT